MCGAAETAGDTAQHSAAQILWRIAEINRESPMVLQVLLRRVLNLAGQIDVPLEDIAEQVVTARDQQRTMTRQAVYEQCKAAAKQWPTLKPFLNPDSTLPRRRKV